MLKRTTSGFGVQNPSRTCSGFIVFRAPSYPPRSSRTLGQVTQCKRDSGTHRSKIAHHGKMDVVSKFPGTMLVDDRALPYGKGDSAGI